MKTALAAATVVLLLSLTATGQAPSTAERYWGQWRGHHSTGVS
jgi:hypothetical protein